ncbi:MAG: sulfite exporter TauE/SafE family protein [Actinobacteria bacterium]|nr:sulfite exporter TauE/SafE family protein [Actinomycetota bacterium]
MIDGLDPATLALLLLAALAAGWVDAVTGGGGMLQVPSLLLALPQAPAAVALGTNKVASVFGTATAAVTYLRSVRPHLLTAVPMAGAAFIAALVGARMAILLPKDVIEPIIVVALSVVWLFLLLRPSLGVEEALRFPAGRRHYVIAITAGVGIGFYDGMVGPGTGSFLIIVLVAGLGYSFLNASVTAKIVNLGTNIAAIIVFGTAGTILWSVGLLMAAANMIGAFLGARTALRRGSRFVRVVFLAVVALLILRLGWDIAVG